MRKLAAILVVLALGAVLAESAQKGKGKGQKAAQNAAAKKKAGKAPAKKKAAGGGKGRGAAASGAGGFTDQQVEQAIHKGVRYLLSQQKGGRWAGGGHGGKYPCGPTAMAVYALLEAGVSPQDPKMVQALLWLAKNKTDRTYSIAVRANCWQAANVKTDHKYRKLLLQDAVTLYRSANKGSHDYPAVGKPSTKRYDNSCSQFGVLGVWAAARDGIEIPGSYWRDVRNHWQGDQNADGGWPYIAGKGAKAKQSGSRATMTVGGVATLFVCADNLDSAQFLRCNRGGMSPAIQKGLNWIDKNFTKSLGGGGHGYYLLYGVERAGLASGYKYFGKQNWYKVGASSLLRRQGANGAWGDVVNTAFALLFLVRGRNAVVFNKLEFEGDWNNRPRDLASLTHWMSINFERTVNWQIINLKVPVSEWHDAPILYISGAKAPSLTAADKAKLRTFVNQGGTILSVTECGGLAFRSAIRKLYKELFPDYELKALPQDHPIYTKKVHYQLAGGKPKLEVVSNGVRFLAVHTDVDVAMQWQSRRSATQKWAYESAVNIVRYVTGGITTLRPRGTTHWPPAAARGGKKISLVRLQHNANCDPEPLAYQRLTRLLAHDANVSLDVTGPVPIPRLARTDAKIATLTGTGTLKLSSAEIEAIKAFVDGGGTLVVDAAGGDRDFAESAKDMLESAYGLAKARPLSTMADVFRLRGHAITKFKYRLLTQMRLGRTSEPALRGITVGRNRRIGVYFSREDLTAALVGYNCFPIDGYAPETAYEILRNIILLAGK